jgi:hypothetical protein
MTSLADADLSGRLGTEEGLERLDGLQKRLLERRLEFGGLIGDGKLGPALCVVFEGWDASGKGGAIKRLVAPLDPRHVTVAQFAAPTERERLKRWKLTDEDWRNREKRPAYEKAVVTCSRAPTTSSRRGT